MSSVLIAYHSFTGKTQSLAEAAAEGARSAGAEVQLSPVHDVSVAAVAAADVLLIATPQTFGTPAAATKDLLERLWMGKDQLPQGKGFASIVCHASEPAATSDLFAKLPGTSASPLCRSLWSLQPRRLRPAAKRRMRWESQRPRRTKTSTCRERADCFRSHISARGEAVSDSDRSYLLWTN